jgi:hypothetical protein
MQRDVILKMVTAPSPLDQTAAGGVHGPISVTTAGANGETQSAPRIVPLTVDEIKRGDYVIYGRGRVMVIDRIGEDVVVLEDPFHPRGKHPVELRRNEFSTKIMGATDEYVKSEYTRLRLPVPEYFDQSDAERREQLIIRDRKDLLMRIKEGITTLVGSKRTTALTRRNLGKWFSELADTFGGELKRAVKEFARQHSPGLIPSYTTIQSWVKFYHDFKNTPEEELPLTRDEARKANPAWAWADRDDESAATTETMPTAARTAVAAEPPRGAAKRLSVAGTEKANGRDDRNDRKSFGRNGRGMTDTDNPDFEQVSSSQNNSEQQEKAKAALTALKIVTNALNDLGVLEVHSKAVQQIQAGLDHFAEPPDEEVKNSFRDKAGDKSDELAQDASPESDEDGTGWTCAGNETANEIEGHLSQTEQ